MQKEKHMPFYSYWLLVNITKRKMGNWKNLKRAILENNVNVQNSYWWRCSMKKAVLKNQSNYLVILPQ